MHSINSEVNLIPYNLGHMMLNSQDHLTCVDE